MKYSKIILFFGISLVFSTLMRYFQIGYTIEFETGFFKSGFEAVGYFIIAAIFASALLTAIFSKTAYNKPEGKPKKNKVLGVISVIPSLAVLLEIFLENPFIYINPLQLILLKITGLAAAAYFILFALNQFIEIKLSSMASAVPCVYIIVRIICDFSGISSLALISDNIFLIGFYCLILLFMLNFAKLYNGMGGDGIFRKLLSLGLSSAIIGVSHSIPFIIINALNKNVYNHISGSANFSILAFSIFAAAFVITYFSKENAE